MEPIEISQEDRKYVRRGIELYIKRVEKCCKDLETVGRNDAATKMSVEADVLKAELVDVELDDMRVMPHHCKAVMKGLEQLAKNQAAAIGTMTGVCEEELADYLRETSKDTKERLMPIFDPQKSLFPATNEATNQD